MITIRPNTGGARGVRAGFRFCALSTPHVPLRMNPAQPHALPTRRRRPAPAGAAKRELTRPSAVSQF